MKTGVLVLWSGCLLSISLSLVHFAWVATPSERLMTLAVLALAAGSLHRK
ncbi:hypothetical protein [Flavonifractor sp. An100]|nr:hypothetical protein [Flavonifractor sp. An100]